MEESSDFHLEKLQSRIFELKPKSICLPEYLMPSIEELAKERKVQISFIPYIVADFNLEADYVVLHKGLLHRLNEELITKILLVYCLDYADEVYATFSKLPVPLKQDALVHIGAIESHLSLSKTETSRPTSKTSTRAIVVSAYGVGNIGDDLVSIGCKNILENAGIKNIQLVGPSVDRQTISEADIVAVGGGGLFYDFEPDNVANYLYPLQEAKRQGKASLVLGIGVQGIQALWSQLAYRTHLNSVDLITVRDQQDKEQLEQIGVTSKIAVTQDLAFLLADELRSYGVKNFAENEIEPVALVSIENQPKLFQDVLEESLVELYAVLIKHLQKSYKVAIAMHSLDDADFLRRIAVAYSVPIYQLERLGPVGTSLLYSAASLIVTTRFHALILSCIFNKKVVCLNKVGLKVDRIIENSIPSLKDSKVCFSEGNKLDRDAIRNLLEKIECAICPNPAEVEQCIQFAKQNYALAAKVLTGFA